MSPLRALFPDQDYGFRMTMRKGDPVDFFAATGASGEILTERARWVAQDSASYTALSPEGVPLLAEVNELGHLWGLPHVADMVEMARNWEPDVLLLAQDESGRFKLQGGALCFPTKWALAEKLGQTLDSIHGVVPGLNPAIGRAIDQFLSGLKPGAAFHRDNWGIYATDERNLHPTRRIPSPCMPVQLDRLWLRVEHQALVALPQGRGVMFGIRIALHRLDDVCKDEIVARGLVRALRTMPPAVATYKGLSRVCAGLISSMFIHK